MRTAVPARYRFRRFGSSAAVTLVASGSALLLGCSAGSNGGDAGSGASDNGGGGLNLSGSASGGSNGSGGGLLLAMGGSDGATPVGPCDSGGWRCKIPDCTGKTPTSIRATVYDPAGVTPLYNVAAYVPNAEVGEIATGAVCETCATPVSGEPIASALTNSHGEFTMNVDVPAGNDVPLVLQIGKWRRVIQLAEVKACEENVFDDPETFRLPRNSSEGHLPKIALTTGEADALECFLRRIGVSDSEFTNPDGPGRINLFHDTSGASSFAGGAAYPPVSSLRASLDSLKGYDIILMSCHGNQAWRALLGGGQRRRSRFHPRKPTAQCPRNPTPRHRPGRRPLRFPGQLGESALHQESGAGARPWQHPLSNGGWDTRALEPRRGGALHDLALAGGRVGDGHARPEHDRESKQHSA